MALFASQDWSAYDNQNWDWKFKRNKPDSSASWSRGIDCAMNLIKNETKQAPFWIEIKRRSLKLPEKIRLKGYDMLWIWCSDPFFLPFGLIVFFLGTAALKICGTMEMRELVAAWAVELREEWVVAEGDMKEE